MDKNERIDLIMSFEDGTINQEDLIRLFKDLKKTGLAYSLQGVYGRTLKQLEEMNLIK